MTTPQLPDPINDGQPVIAYRVGQLEDAVKLGFKEHNEKLDKLINNFATKEEIAVISARVKDLESDRKWLVRLVMGAVIFALLSLIGIGFKTFN